MSLEIYEALDDRHIRITCSEDGNEWFWENTDTGERSDWVTDTARNALMQAASEFNIVVEDPHAGDEEDFDDDAYDDSMDGDHASALASAGWGTDEDYGMAYDHLEFGCDETYEPDYD